MNIPLKAPILKPLKEDIEIYDIIYIGFGPATIFSILDNPELYNKKVLVLEKGDSLKNRDEKEIVFGSGGAGAFSDSKLVSNPLVGGDIQNLNSISPSLFDNLADRILYYYNEFYDGDKGSFNWMPIDPYELPSDKLKLLKSRVCHIGSDRSREVFKNIEEEISHITELKFNEEVVNFFETNFGCFEVYTNKGKYLTKKLVVGVGKRSSLVQNAIERFNLKTTPNRVQIGVRVECLNTYFKELVDKFYDFKIVMKTKLGRWRTFCVNSSNAHVVVEKGEGFVSANGHAYSGGESTGLTNFGIMGDLDLKWSREEQLALVIKTSKGGEKSQADICGNTLIAQDIEAFKYRVIHIIRTPTTLSKDDWRYDNLWDYYPEEICLELKEFIEEIQKYFPFEGHFMAPEIKLTNSLIKMSPNFEVYPGLFVIGDASSYTRSIIQAGISGMLVGRKLSE